MTDSLLTFPLRLTVRTTRRALRTTRDVADLGLIALDLVDRVLGDDDEPVAAPAPRAPFPAPPMPIPTPPREASNGTGPAPVPATEIDAGLEEIVHPGVEDVVLDEVELVDEVADPGAEEGAGASIHVEPPFDGYDALKAPDIIARLPGSDAATLAAIELYEATHRRRRTVLDAVGREARRRG